MKNNTHKGSFPSIALGPHNVSRLILGANPINGGSHLSRFVNMQMKRYFTEGRILELLSLCEKEGINTWQSGLVNIETYVKYREAGGNMHFISLVHEADEEQDGLRRLQDAGAIAGAYHGEVTDSLFKNGNIENARDFLSKVRDHGMLAGVSTHMPDVVDYIETKGWDVDFYMTCVYERHRSKDELRSILNGHVPLSPGEVYLEEDPPRMRHVMNQTQKPCLASKILAAGRVCDQQELVEEAFKATMTNIKNNDAVIVGMYPEYEDQVALNAGYVRTYSAVGEPAKNDGLLSASR